MNDRSPRDVPGASPAGGSGDGPVLHPDVQALVDRAVAGDDDAYAEIFRRFRDKVYRISHRFTRDHDEAMDLLIMEIMEKEMLGEGDLGDDDDDEDDDEDWD